MDKKYPCSIAYRVRTARVSIRVPQRHLGVKLGLEDDPQD